MNQPGVCSCDLRVREHPWKGDRMMGDSRGCYPHPGLNQPKATPPRNVPPAFDRRRDRRIPFLQSYVHRRLPHSVNGSRGVAAHNNSQSPITTWVATIITSSIQSTQPTVHPSYNPSVSSNQSIQSNQRGGKCQVWREHTIQLCSKNMSKPLQSDGEMCSWKPET